MERLDGHQKVACSVDMTDLDTNYFSDPAKGKFLAILSGNLNLICLEGSHKI